VFCTGPAFRFRPWPAIHRRAKRARRGALRATEFDAGPAFYFFLERLREGTIDKLNAILARLRATLKL
jgi:hypothetical protein